MNIRRKTSAMGFGLIEIVVAVSIISITLYALIATTHAAFKIVSKNSARIQAEFLAEEAIEAVRSLRDTSWSENISTRTSEFLYYPKFSTVTNVWTLESLSPGLIDNMFTQIVILSDVYRDANADITAPATPGASLDDGTKLVKARVTWNDELLEISTYITNVFDN
ncbi:MAG: type II secretion system protein [bacterium]|nr:type II secretion system protein [bacterium]